MNPTKITVKPGIVRVNEGIVMARSDTCAALSIDLHTKRAAVSGHLYMGDLGVPGVVLGTTEETLHTDPELLNETIVLFDDFPRWDVWCADVGRYTLAVCLIKRDVNNHVGSEE